MRVSLRVSFYPDPEYLPRFPADRRSTGGAFGYTRPMNDASPGLMGDAGADAAVTPRTTKSRSRQRWVSFLACLAVFLSPALHGTESAVNGNGLLDGYRFLGPTGAEGRPANHDDYVSFDTGRFFSAGCSRWGFGDGAYRSWRTGNAIGFEAVTKSTRNGRLVWRGTVHGERIEAVFVWTKERLLWTTRRAYWFRGSRTDAENPYESAQ